MPISKHFGGAGEKVAATMQKEYGQEWKRVFYATENKMKAKKHDPVAALKALQRKPK